MTIDLVRAFLVREFFHAESAQSIPLDQSLIASGLLDSVATLKLVLFLERQFNVDIESMDIVEGKLDTLNDIAKLVASKQTR